jgi:hypothetical protein
MLEKKRSEMFLCARKKSRIRESNPELKNFLDTMRNCKMLTPFQFKEIARVSKKLGELEERDKRIHTDITYKSGKLEIDRDVCLAFVIFNKIEYQKHILHVYRNSKNFLLRMFLSRKEMFEKRHLQVFLPTNQENIRIHTFDNFSAFILH